jgi:hypothetical protein
LGKKGLNTLNYQWVFVDLIIQEGKTMGRITFIMKYLPSPVFQKFYNMSSHEPLGEKLY